MARPAIHVHRFNANLTKKIVHHATDSGETVVGFTNRVVKDHIKALEQPQAAWREFTEADRDLFDRVHDLVTALLSQDGGETPETPMDSLLYVGFLWHEAMFSAEGLEALNAIAKELHKH